MRKGLSPILGFVLLTVMVIGLAASTVTFLQSQQERVGEELAGALGEELQVRSISCQGRTVSIRLANTGDTRITQDEASLLVREGGEINYSFAQSRSVTMAGGFQEPGGAGYVNVSAGALFRSGRTYRIQLDFEGSDRGIDEICRAGSDWWDLNYNHRRQVQFSDAIDPRSNITKVQLNTSRLAEEGKLRSDCRDIRVVSDGESLEYDLNWTGDSCGESQRTNVTFRVDSLQQARGTTYLYYGNPTGQLGDLSPAARPVDLFYVVDTSASFPDEFETLEGNVSVIEQQLEEQRLVDVVSRVYGLNNTYNGWAAARRVCKEGQTLPGSLYCAWNYTFIEDITDVEPYVQYLNQEQGYDLDVSDYDPVNIASGPEAPTEGWGQGVLDILGRDVWREGAVRFVIAIGDHDTNGGGASDGCGDPVSEDLAVYLGQQLPEENVTGIGVLGDVECRADPQDGEHDTYAERQLDMIGDVIRYGSTSEMVEKIIAEVQRNIPPAPVSSLGREEEVDL